MLKSFLLSASFILFGLHGQTCVNEYRTQLNGKVYYSDATRGRILEYRIDTAALRQEANWLLSRYSDSDSIEYLSDYAAKLIYLGEYNIAKNTYFKIEQLKPKLYTTASNLGTIYELAGQPDSALIWIRESIRLNPNSHEGSEWIHIKILEFKLNPNKNYNISVLGLNFGHDPIPKNPNQYNLQELKKHIWRQLQERTKFVKPENKIVGNIYFDLGNVIAQINSVEAAAESYSAAVEYGYESELFKKRRSKFEKLMINALPYRILEKLKHHFDKVLLFCFISLTGLGFRIMIIIYRKQRQKKSS